MVYEGFARLGGVEIVNSERVRGYSDSSDCPPSWFVGKRCETLRDALGDNEYTHSNISDAPWYDSSLADLSGRFHGVYGLSISGLSNSTRSANTTEGIDDGGVVGRTRKGMREVRVTADLMAEGRDALEYGISWINSAMDPGHCSSHGSACGTTDFEYFTDCPPPRAEVWEYTTDFNPTNSRPQTDAEYAAVVDPLRRVLHDVSVTSGPIEIQRYESKRGGYWGARLEWTVTSERAWVYSTTRDLALPVTPSTVIQDIPYNLALYPSAELAASTTDWLAAKGPVGQKITVPTHISPAGGQTTHPSVIRFEEPWNGYEYWMAHTPYPVGNEAHEDPNISASQDGITWVKPAGLTNPLDDKPGSPGPYNSDVELVYGPDGMLWLMWRTYDPGATGREEQIYIRKSSNGVNWSPKVLVMQNSETVRRLLSPSLIYENGAWTMYAVDMVPTPNRIVRLRSSGTTMKTDGWTTPTTVGMSPALASTREPWHLQVRKVDSNYVGILNDCAIGESGIDGDLYVIQSSTGTSFTRASSVAIPRSGAGHTALYRSSLVQSGVGALDVWYAGWTTSPIVWNIFKTKLLAPIGTGVVVTATNHVLNPSVEADATHWAHMVGSVTGSSPTPYLTSGRVTGELAAVGAASFRARLLGNGIDAASGSLLLSLRQTAAIPTNPGTRISVSVWGAAIVNAGAAGSKINFLRVRVIWQNASSASVGEVILDSSSDPSGSSWDIASLEPPSTAEKAVVLVEASIDWASSATPANNSDIRLYADALAVTTP